MAVIKWVEYQGFLVNLPLVCAHHLWPTVSGHNRYENRNCQMALYATEFHVQSGWFSDLSMHENHNGAYYKSWSYSDSGGVQMCFGKHYFKMKEWEAS